MGNCFGKESKSGGGNFKGAGHTIGPAQPVQADPPAPVRAGIPAAAGPGRTVGGSEGGSDARSAAAAAAEARANKIAGTDKLSQNLAAQKKAGMKGALSEASEENRRQREADAMNEARTFN